MQTQKREQIMLKRVKNKIKSGYKLLKKPSFWPREGVIKATAYEHDVEFLNRYLEAQIKTQMNNTDNPLRRQRHYTLINALKNVPLNSGDIAECGCFRGLSAWQISEYLKQIDFRGKFDIFDSFEGLSIIDEIDTPTDRLQNNKAVQKQFACSLEKVSDNLKSFDFINYHKGWIPEKFNDLGNKKYSFVHIDVDLYRPIKDCCEFFWPRLCQNGVMVFDDYGCTQFPGAKIAVDEFLESIGPNKFFIHLPSGQAMLINL